MPNSTVFKISQFFESGNSFPSKNPNKFVSPPPLIEYNFREMTFSDYDHSRWSVRSEPLLQYLYLRNEQWTVHRNMISAITIWKSKRFCLENMVMKYEPNIMINISSSIKFNAGHGSSTIFAICQQHISYLSSPHDLLILLSSLFV